MLYRRSRSVAFAVVRLLFLRRLVRLCLSSTKRRWGGRRRASMTCGRSEIRVLILVLRNTIHIQITGSGTIRFVWVFRYFVRNCWRVLIGDCLRRGVGFRVCSRLNIEIDMFFIRSSSLNVGYSFVIRKLDPSLGVWVKRILSFGQKASDHLEGSIL